MLQSLPTSAFNSIFMMLFKYKQYNKIINLYLLMQKNTISLSSKYNYRLDLNLVFYSLYFVRMVVVANLKMH